jgi:hypothetical protein
MHVKYLNASLCSSEITGDKIQLNKFTEKTIIR